MATTGPKAHVILNRPSDWDEWFDIVKRKGRNAETSEHVNIDLPQEPPPLAPPTKPTPQCVLPMSFPSSLDDDSPGAQFMDLGPQIGPSLQKRP
jgi:hypothetical protein